MTKVIKVTLQRGVRRYVIPSERVRDVVAWRDESLVESQAFEQVSVSPRRLTLTSRTDGRLNDGEYRIDVEAEIVHLVVNAPPDDTLFLVVTINE